MSARSSTTHSDSKPNLQTKKFQRRKESFTCSQCGTSVDGDGYTDHCPDCLWSKHVDINPGDRASNCNGMMKPVGYSPQEKTIFYSCKKCNEHSKVKVAKDDNKPLLTKLSSIPLP